MTTIYDDLKPQFEALLSAVRGKLDLVHDEVDACLETENKIDLWLRLEDRNLQDAGYHLICAMESLGFQGADDEGEVA